MRFLAQLRPLAPRIAQFEIWVLGAAILASLANPNLQPAAVIAAAFFVLLRWLAYGRPIPRTPLDWAILPLLIMLGVTTWITPLPEITLPQVFRLLLGIAFFYTLVNWCDSSKRQRQLVLGLILAGLFLSLSAPFIVEWTTRKMLFIPTNILPGFALLVSDTVHPNVIAGNLVLILPFALVWILFAWEEAAWFERLLSVCASLLMIAVLFLTKSRSAWVAAGISTLLIPVLRWRRGWVVPVLVVLVLSVMIYSMGISPFVEYLAPSGAMGGLEERLDVWSRGVFMIRDFPFTGIGMGLFQPLSDRLYPLLLSSPGKIAHSHNLFLQVAIDLGLPGLVAWLACLLLICLLSWKVFRSGRRLTDRRFSALGAGLLCSLAALVVNGLTDAVNWGMVRTAPLVWTIWALATASYLVNLQIHAHPQATPHPTVP